MSDATHLRRLRSGRVHRLAGPVALVLAEGGLVHEHVGLVGGLDDSGARRGVPREDRPPAAHVLPYASLAGVEPADAMAKTYAPVVGQFRYRPALPLRHATLL